MKIKEEAEVGKFYRNAFLRSLSTGSQGDPEPPNYTNDDSNILHVHSTFDLSVHFYMYCLIFLFLLLNSSP